LISFFFQNDIGAPGAKGAAGVPGKSSFLELNIDMCF